MPGLPAQASGARPAASSALSEHQLRAALVTASDLPRGWARDGDPGQAQDGAPTTYEPASCGAIFATLAPGAGTGLPSVAASYSRGGPEGSRLDMSITAFPGLEAATRLRRVSAALPRCARVRAGTGGDAVGLSVTPLAFPTMGEQVQALRVTVTGAGAGSVSDAVLAARDGALVVFVSDGPHPIPGPELQALVRAGLGRLARFA